MMSFLLHTEPAGKMNRIFDVPGQNEMAEIVLPRVINNRRNKIKDKTSAIHGHGLHREGNSKNMLWMQNQNLKLR